MAAHKVHLRVDQGSTFDQKWQWKLTGSPVDLTGCTARSQVRQTQASESVILSMTTASGQIVLNETPGSVRIRLTDEVTATLIQGVYDLFIDFPSGDSVRLMFGDFMLAQRITRT